MSELKTTRPENLDKEFPAGRGGAKVTVWRVANNARSITISPPRYKDGDTGKWRDGAFFLPDAALLIFALQQALAYCFSLTVPSSDNDAP